MKTFKAWLELGRVSNLPTVWSNAIHGLAVGIFVAAILPIERDFGYTLAFGWPQFGRVLNQGFVLLVGLSLLYVGGMFLNDACDARIDADERPNRPIPSGRISRPHAFFAAAALLAVGWACTLVYVPMVQISAAALVAAIVAYNLLHHIRGLGLVFMPICRGLVVWIAASAIVIGAGIDDDLPRIFGSVLAVACYTLIITLIAWGEALPSLGRWSRGVGIMIALMPLIDIVFVLQFEMWPMIFFCLACAVISLAAQRFIPGS
ncbi:MAG: UbiA family prenyltransferase [Planctomycetota bacterium]